MSLSAATFTGSGSKSTASTQLDKSVFGEQPANHELIKLAYASYLANGRVNLAAAKTRSVVSGGGKKPWRQKGTGRARAGSIRSPLWRGGGITFGPTGTENYSKNMSLATKRKALRQALSLAATEGRVKVIESFESKDGKTGKVLSLFEKIQAGGRVLLVVNVKDDMAKRATRNLQNTNLVQARYLNVYDIINADTLVVTKDTLQIISEWLGVPAKKAPRSKAGESAGGK